MGQAIYDLNPFMLNLNSLMMCQVRIMLKIFIYTFKYLLANTAVVRSTFYCNVF